jgi:hypothetical protein
MSCIGQLNIQHFANFCLCFVHRSPVENVCRQASRVFKAWSTNSQYKRSNKSMLTLMSFLSASYSWHRYVMPSLTLQRVLCRMHSTTLAF